MAVHFYQQRSYDEAEPPAKRAFTILEKRLGPEHPNAAPGLDNLALLDRAQGKNGEAEPLHPGLPKWLARN